MNLMDYLAFGGLERLLLIGAAILITYWGYHLYGKAQIAGLAMIAVAALLLMSVVLTSGRHQQAVNADQLAALPVAAPTTEPTVIMQPPVAEIVEEPVEVVAQPERGDNDSPFVEASPEPAVVAQEATPATEDAAISAEFETSVEAAEAVEAVEADRIERLVPLASGQELGGRITSVRSENVTLEWSAEDSRRRVISASSTP